MLCKGSSLDTLKEKQHVLDRSINQAQTVAYHEVREYPIEVIVHKFMHRSDLNDAELYLPDYQRPFIWTTTQKSLFIESLLLNLPIPYLFAADTRSKEGRLEIIDGSQRIQTLVEFLNNKFALKGLEKIPEANGFTFGQFSKLRQRRFNRKTLYLIELTEHSSEETKQQIFKRLNTGGTPLNQTPPKMDAFNKFINELSENVLLRKLAPISFAKDNATEYQILVLRYLAYANHYLNFDNNISRFLAEYSQHSKRNGFDARNLIIEFNQMLLFVSLYFPNYFKKSPKYQTVSRARFETIAVGVTLALRENPRLIPNDPSLWLDSLQFKQLSQSGIYNDKNIIKKRFEFVRDSLLDRR